VVRLYPLHNMHSEPVQQSDATWFGSHASDSVQARLGNVGDGPRTLHAKHFIPLFSELFPQAQIDRLADVGHYSLEDVPETMAARITSIQPQT
jgi:hypothetical protein